MTALARDWRRRIRDPLSLEDRNVRFLAVLGLVLLTLASPNVSLPGSLPAIRLEQVLLAIIVIPLVAFHRRHPERRSTGLVDYGFLALGISTILSILLVPFLLSGVGRSFRDLFEVVRIAQYWIVFRLAMTLEPADLQAARLGRWLAVAGIVLGLLAILQFVDLPGFNASVTAIWTESHNLIGVATSGRAVGTAGNANQFGILAALLLLTCLAELDAGAWSSRAWILRGAAIAATIGLVLAQSRGAILAAIVALVVALGLSLVRHQGRHALRTGLPPIVLGGLLAVTLMVVAPPDSGSALGRFDLLALVRDPSIVIRLGRLESLFSRGNLPSPGPSDRDACLADLMISSPEPGHEPGGAAPATAPGTFESAVGTYATAVGSYFCDTGSWPTGDPASSLVPAYLGAVPTDPSTGGPIPVYTSKRGFSVGPTTSDASGADAAGLGSLPNLILNPSFEYGSPAPDSWAWTPGATLTRQDDAQAAYGGSDAQATIPAGGGVFQFAVADLPMSTAFTTGVWVRSSDGHAGQVQLYVVPITAAGRRIEPFAQAGIDLSPDGHWQHLAVAFTTPNEHLTSLQLIIRAPADAIAVTLDGATLTEGPIPRSFGSLVDVPPSQAIGQSGPSLGSSPIFGVGPQKDETVITYDNEYVSFLQHYGIVGLLAYLFLFFTAFAVALQVGFRRTGWPSAMGTAVAVFTIALGVFAVSAGAYRQLQVMLIFWILVGLVVAIRRFPPADSPAT